MRRLIATSEYKRRCAAWLAAAGVAVTVCSGCVSRRMMVYCNPPDALVLLEGKEVGYTPVAVDFTFYGTREITLIKDGYETKKVMQRVPAPWYQWPVIEFFSDNLLFGHVTDRQRFVYSLEPRVMPSNEDTLDRGESLRSESMLSP